MVGCWSCKRGVFCSYLLVETSRLREGRAVLSRRSYLLVLGVSRWFDRSRVFDDYRLTNLLGGACSGGLAVDVLHLRREADTL